MRRALRARGARVGSGGAEPAGGSGGGEGRGGGGGGVARGVRRRRTRRWHALRDAGERARGATLYVTLEPCSHYGKTPPCSLAVREAGISRLVFAMPRTRAPGRGAGPRTLAEAGVEVVSGVEEVAARDLNARFLPLRAGRRRRPALARAQARSLAGRARRRTSRGAPRGSPARRRAPRCTGCARATTRWRWGSARCWQTTRGSRYAGRWSRGARRSRVVFDRRLRLPLDSALVRYRRGGAGVGRLRRPARPAAARRAAGGPRGARAPGPRPPGALVAPCARRGSSRCSARAGPPSPRRFWRRRGWTGSPSSTRRSCCGRAGGRPSRPSPAPPSRGRRAGAACGTGAFGPDTLIVLER